ncbi:MAG: nucleoside deaminase [Thermomicrobiales bacterium]
MTTRDHEAFMRIAIEEAVRSREEGNSAVGSIVVRDGEVIARGRNLVSTNHDVTAHAETVALREAGAALETENFEGCTLYTTFEPCPMCCGAILLSGISTLVVGGRPEPGASLWHDYTVEGLIDSLGRSHTINVIGNVLADECVALRP